MKYYIVRCLILVALFISCSDSKNKEYLPKATGKPGDVLVFMDSLQWNGELGQEFRKIFLAPFPGSPQNEPSFNVIWVHPSRGLSMLKQMRNLVYVFTLDQKSSGTRTLLRQFSEPTLNRIRTDTTFHMATAQEEFAKGQEVMYLMGNTEEDLIRFLQNQKQAIADYFNNAERKRLTAELNRTRSTEGLTAFLRTEQNVELRVPIGYKLADRAANFAWFRNPAAEIDKNVFLSWKPYRSEYQLLPDSLIEWRNEIAKQHLFENPANPESYLVTEQEDAKVHARQIKMNGNFAMELRGLWRTNLRTMGGPFISYALVDEPRGLLYYIEGFAYAPGKDKREIIRDLETTLWTFRTIPPAKK